MSLFGNILCGTSAGMFRFADFGIDPYNSGVIGLWHITGLFDFGTFSMLLCFLLLAVDLIFFDRKKLGVGTIINMFLMGYVIEFVDWFLRFLMPHPSLAVRIIFLFAALALLCYSSSMYYVADLGVSPYDCIPISVSEMTKVRFRIIRIIADFTWVVVGIAGRQMPGIATILIAFCLGPFIEFFHPLNQKLLRGHLKSRNLSKRKAR